jgi:hypothetical protein
VKFAVAFPLLTAASCDDGANTIPGLLGVTVYVPFSKFKNEYVPELLAVVVPVPAPLNVRVAPLPAADGVILPEILKVAPTAGRTSAMLKL